MKKTSYPVIFLASLLLLQFSSIAGIHSSTFLQSPDSVVSVNVVPDCDTACGMSYPLPNTPILGQTGEWNCSSSAISFQTIDSVFYAEVSNISPNNPATYTLVWTETGPGFTANDTIEILFAPTPSGDIKAIYEPHCIGYPAKLKAHDDYSIVYWDWVDMDGGTIIYPANPIPDSLGQGPVFVKWHNPTYGEEHYVKLITTNVWGCISPTDADTISEPNSIYVYIYVQFSTDGLANGEISLYPQNSSLINIYNWIDTLGITWADPMADHQIDLLAADYWFSANAKSLTEPNDSNYRCTDTFMVTVPDSVLSINVLENNSKANLHIYPNPVSEIATLTFETPSFDEYSISVFNKQGQLVLYRKVELNTGRQELVLNIEELVPGNYSVQIHSSELNSRTSSFSLQNKFVKIR
ncbi:MAG: T9SS type A sorting domain-containing protein [Bacteroidota bacterium]|nr:T9SS type A sorting domain-containing protein [Bacteroidota bacterium]